MSGHTPDTTRRAGGVGVATTGAVLLAVSTAGLLLLTTLMLAASASGVERDAAGSFLLLLLAGPVLMLCLAVGLILCLSAAGVMWKARAEQPAATARRLAWIAVALLVTAALHCGVLLVIAWGLPLLAAGAAVIAVLGALVGARAFLAAQEAGAPVGRFVRVVSIGGWVATAVCLLVPLALSLLLPLG